MRGPVNDWSGLGPLPEVNPYNKGRRSYTWEQKRADYASLPKSALIITAELITPIVHAERGKTHLDSLLAFAALTDHPVASHYKDAVTIPLPLEMAWMSPAGLPLWACTPLLPVSTK